jgi:hydrogenase maturation protein HypF
MRLEAIAAEGNPELVDHGVEIYRKDGKYVLNTSNTLYFMSKILNKYKKQDIAAFGQKYLSDGVSEMAIKTSEDTGISVIGLSGGVFVNEYITRTVANNLREAGLTVLFNTKVPPGDGGTALGQVCNALDSVM